MANNKNRFYISYPLRTARMNPKRTRFFYVFLAVIWLVASIYLFINNPTGNILFPLFYLGVGIGIVILSIYYERVIFGLYIDLGSREIELRLQRGNSRKIKWSEIDSVEIGNKNISLNMKKGDNRFINLHSFKDEDWNAFRGAFEKIARGEGISVVYDQ